MERDLVLTAGSHCQYIPGKAALRPWSYWQVSAVCLQHVTHAFIDPVKQLQLLDLIS